MSLFIGQLRQEAVGESHIMFVAFYHHWPVSFITPDMAGYDRTQTLVTINSVDLGSSTSGGGGRSAPAEDPGLKDAARWARGRPFIKAGERQMAGGTRFEIWTLELKGIH